ncbi:hypothetical protein [endosymbiont GvMRE of Glomus versiforme]|uniref:hypothetical protein n=1 Tax=endosymbiont GvMRE of Glomus versiforme TaxID=2039283 RepID=UPI000EF025C6|nr:hypothetical protein [endosymbiont GvMRE of Glomus versiforme]RHZ36446.1 HET domain protein [endosymbiont GvMRE of Glomus versiforme]
MVNAQEWLDRNYPKEERNSTKELFVNEVNFTDTLDLSDFVNLEELYCYDNQLLTNLNLDNCTKLKKIRCPCNQLNNLDLTNCSKLEKLECFYDNYLQDLKLPAQAEQLTYLDIRNNNLSERDLSMFSHLINLESLFVNDNRFVGSLKPLQNLTKLEDLDISNTDIDSGVEYLSDSVESFRFSADERKDARCQVFFNFFPNEKGIIEVDEDDRIIDFPQKLQAYKQKIAKEKARELLKEELQEKDQQIQELKIQLEQTQKENKELKQQLTITQTENQSLLNLYNNLWEQINNSEIIQEAKILQPTYGTPGPSKK